MNARNASLNIGLHNLIRIQRAAKASFGIGKNRREPIFNAFAAFGMFNLIGTLQSAVDLARQFWAAIGGIKRLVGIHRTRHIRVRRHLPAGEIDRLQTSANHLHGLVAGKGTQSVGEGIVVELIPEPRGPHLGQRVALGDGAAQLLHIGWGIRPLDPVKAGFGSVGDQVCESCHRGAPKG